MNYKDKAGYYAIHIASRMDHVDCIKIMLKINKSLVNSLGGSNKMTPLMYAAAYGNLETV